MPILIKTGDNVAKRCDQMVQELYQNRKVTLSNGSNSCQKLIAVVEIVKSKMMEREIKIYQYNRVNEQLSGAVAGVKRQLAEEGENPGEARPRKGVELSVILSLDALKLDDEWTSQ